ncbi:MAG: hypothetical protein IPO78_10325 [Saprospiraceae bacterium]|nr:hypothetical protein [Saprospiraceae bacterium]
MLSINEFSNLPIRQGQNDACLLCSYSTALFPFTQTIEIQYFIECCELLGISLLEQNDALNFQHGIVDSRIGTFTFGSGYDWIEELHLNCPSPAYKNARKLTKINRRFSRDDVEVKLDNQRTSSIITLKFPNNTWHSICITKDPQFGFIARDSARPLALGQMFDAIGSTIEQLISNLYGDNVVEIGEAILFSKNDYLPLMNC